MKSSLRRFARAAASVVVVVVVVVVVQAGRWIVFWIVTILGE